MVCTGERERERNIMISSITFSKDRACQLDLHLDSLAENGNKLFDPYVLYNFSTYDFSKGYERLTKTRLNIKFYCEFNHFKYNFLLLLNNFQNPYVCLFTDDDILYRKLNINEENIDRLFHEYPNMLTLSLRLGSNTVIQDPYNNTPTTFPGFSLIGSSNRQ